jgi:serine/threonine protein kinase
VSETRIGSTVAGYRIESLLGRGGMSVVYLAEHLRLGRMVALKVLAPALAHDEDFRERFIRESRRAAELDHPNVISIYDAGEVEGGEAEDMLYIAMRYVQGSDLKSILRRDGPLSVGRTLFLLEQVAAGLDAAHDHDLIHRDVKPANIMVAEPSDHVYLTDFGVVKHTTTRGLTRTGIFVGTVDYAAPEQIEGLPLDARTDVYALGCVLYECLAGRPPYDREAEVAVMHAHLAEPPPKLLSVRPELPPALDRVIAMAMAKSKDDRFSRCPELIDSARAAVLQRHPAPSVAVPEPALPRAETPAPAYETPSAVPGEPVPAAVTPPPASVPSEPAHATPAPAAPAEAAADGRSRGPWTHWLVTAALVLAGALISAAAVYFATRDDSGSTTVAQSTAPAPAPQHTLASIVPEALWKSCKVDSAPDGAAVETAACGAPPNASSSFPDSWKISMYPDGKSLLAAYETARKSAGVAQGQGRCDGVSWGGEGAWVHGPDKPGGHRFCYFAGDDAVIVWTHERLGQASHRDVLAIAREGGSDHARLFNWWRFWHHLIGKVST